MADSEFTKYANAIAMREAALRQNVAAAANMGTSIQQIGAQTDVQGSIDPLEIPTVAGLANLQATTQQQSTLREKRGKTAIGRMPAYQKSYRAYLQWRYPNRYGGGSTYGYTTPPGGYQPSITIPSLPAPKPPVFEGVKNK